MGCPAASDGSSTHHGSGSGGGDKGASDLWWLGVILSIIGSTASNMGVNLQKYSFMREAKRSVNLKRGYMRQPLWVVGLLLVIGGSVLDFVALGFLPQSLAAPVGGSTMVANVVFASLFLKEKFTRMDAIGTSLVLIGIVVVASFADKESGCYTIHELVALYREPLFIVYALLMALAASSLYAFSKRMERIKAKHGTSSPEYKRFRKIHPVSYPALSGICGAQSILFAKSVAELVKTTAEGDSQFGSGVTYVLPLAMFASVFLQIHWLAHGLQLFDAVFVVPVFQCFFISVSILGGGVYFNEFAHMSPLSLGMFFFGAAITISGVYLLAHRDMHRLKPRGRFRAAVAMVIFIKRTQKARSLPHRWVQGEPVVLEKSPRTGHHHHLHLPGTIHSPKLANGKPTFTHRKSKSSVVPVTGYMLDHIGDKLSAKTKSPTVTPRTEDKLKVGVSHTKEDQPHHKDGEHERSDQPIESPDKHGASLERNDTAHTSRLHIEFGSNMGDSTREERAR